MASNQINYSKFTIHFSVFVFIIFYSFYLILRFKNIEPMGDQAFQIYWLSNLLNREVFASDNNSIGFFKSLFDQIFIKKNLSIGGLKIFLTENYPDNFFYHLAKVMASPNNFFAYYWHSFYIIVLYIFNLCFGHWFENLNESYVYFSIIFSSLSIYVCYLIYEMFLQKINFSKNSISIKVIIFILSTLSYHKFYYSPLGVHNFAIFMFLLTIYFFLKIIISNSGNYKNYFYLGLLCSISIISHQANFLLLFPTIFICIFFLSNKLYSIKTKNLFSFMIFPSLVLTPLLFLCYLTFIKAGPGGASFSLHYFLRFGEENYRLESLFLWLKNILILIGPILIISIFFFKKKKNNNFKNFYILIFVLFSIHLFFTITTGWFIESYLRNMLYLNYIITTLLLLLSLITFLTKLILKLH